MYLSLGYSCTYIFGNFSQFGKTLVMFFVFRIAYKQTSYTTYYTTYAINYDTVCCDGYAGTAPNCSRKCAKMTAIHHMQYHSLPTSILLIYWFWSSVMEFVITNTRALIFCGYAYVCNLVDNYISVPYVYLVIVIDAYLNKYTPEYQPTDYLVFRVIVT